MTGKEEKPASKPLEVCIAVCIFVFGLIGGAAGKVIGSKLFSQPPEGSGLMQDIAQESTVVVLLGAGVILGGLLGTLLGLGIDALRKGK